MSDTEEAAPSAPPLDDFEPWYGTEDNARQAEGASRDDPDEPGAWTWDGSGTSGASSGIRGLAGWIRTDPDSDEEQFRDRSIVDSYDSELTPSAPPLEPGTGGVAFDSSHHLWGDKRGLIDGFQRMSAVDDAGSSGEDMSRRGQESDRSGSPPYVPLRSSREACNRSEPLPHGSPNLRMQPEQRPEGPRSELAFHYLNRRDDNVADRSNPSTEVSSTAECDSSSSSGSGRDVRNEQISADTPQRTQPSRPYVPLRSTREACRRDEPLPHGSDNTWLLPEETRLASTYPITPPYSNNSHRGNVPSESTPSEPWFHTDMRFMQREPSSRGSNTTAHRPSSSSSSRGASLTGDQVPRNTTQRSPRPYVPLRSSREACRRTEPLPHGAGDPDPGPATSHEITDRFPWQTWRPPVPEAPSAPPPARTPVPTPAPQSSNPRPYRPLRSPAEGTGRSPTGSSTRPYRPLRSPEEGAGRSSTGHSTRPYRPLRTPSETCGVTSSSRTTRTPSDAPFSAYAPCDPPTYDEAMIMSKPSPAPQPTATLVSRPPDEELPSYEEATQ